MKSATRNQYRLPILVNPANDVNQNAAAAGKSVKVILSHDLITRSTGLLHMRYSVTELATVIQTPAETIRAWISQGRLPHIRDQRAHIWIDGHAFRDWVRGWVTRRRRVKLQTGEAYCCSCNGAVRPIQAQECIREIKSRRVHVSGAETPRLHWRRVLIGICPHCGHRVNRVLACGPCGR